MASDTRPHLPLPHQRRHGRPPGKQRSLLHGAALGRRPPNCTSIRTVRTASAWPRRTQCSPPWPARLKDWLMVRGMIPADPEVTAPPLLLPSKDWDVQGYPCRVGAAALTGAGTARSASDAAPRPARRQGRRPRQARTETRRPRPPNAKKSLRPRPPRPTPPRRTPSSCTRPAATTSTRPQPGDIVVNEDGTTDESKNIPRCTAPEWTN